MNVTFANDNMDFSKDIQINESFIGTLKFQAKPRIRHLSVFKAFFKIL